ncbi:Stk1 family PASTA domain-containing Ser/Thr kinase [Bifidobacterium simiarum]|uniref:non-specific serine/threonine protein kinase n=1 Tax=Bifidobacterium simiarum TaxID=2045441 RepID=A0A2M9HEM4_9BIFI|nr:Stk1 family PASTA domain-containing Ser/Thr kinase [Bifidobacterium simiarum]PJM75249.1 serine/threonine protein kinase [Bifidobacterium simiarum]
MSEVTEAPIGKVVDGRYRIVRRIAEGGMATVYEARDVRLDRTVAVKIMHTQLAQGPHRDQFVQRFQREARSAAAIANTHIVQIYDTGEYEGLDYLVMEYVHGVNLRYEMNRQGTFTVRETLRIVGEILDGLAAAHGVGVVHRDIKPENIMINDRGRVQITDFGLAKAASQATLATTGMLLGTAAYLAPEMIENNQATPQGDLYSVGIVAWEMLTGEVPFVSDNPVTMVFKHVHEDIPPLRLNHPSLPAPVSDFIAELTNRSIDRRPSDAMAALVRLSETLDRLSPADLSYRIGDQDDHATTLLPIGEPPAPRTGGAGTGTASVKATKADGTGDDGDAGSAAPSAPARSSTPVKAADRTDGAAADADTHPHAGKTVPVKPKRHRMAIAIVIAVVALAASVGGGFAWWYYLGPGSYWEVPAADDVNCAQGESCSLKNADFAAYERTLKVSGIPYSSTEQYSDTVKKGDIISSTPAQVGDRISKRHGESMTFVVSKGVQKLTIPADITDSASANGKDPVAALSKIGFGNVKHDAAADQYSMDVPEGAAISVSPKPGSTIDHNQQVTVVLSKGLMPVTMPNINGMTRASAKAALEALHLNVTFTEEFSDSVDAGKVSSASAKTGESLHWKDSVSVVISKGPQMASVPNLVGKSTADATKTLTGMGFKVKVNVQVKKPNSNDPVFDMVSGTNPAAGSSVRLRDKSGNATTITINVV